MLLRCIAAAFTAAAAYPVHAQLFGEVAKLTAGDAGFGNSVAIDVDTIVLGASSEDGSAGIDQGSAHVFVRVATSWFHQQQLTASDAAPNDYFGYLAAMDGDTIVVTAVAGHGSAYVFVRSGTTWSEQQKLTPSDGAADDLFGISVDVDGDTVVVGALYDDGPAGANQGSAYIFAREGTTWTQQQKLAASDAAADDHFGVDVLVDGDTVVVGASNNTGPVGSHQGSAYVFVRARATWTEQQKLTASDAAPHDFFGSSVAVDGDTVLVGAPFNDGPAGDWQGSAYVFVREGTTWSEQQQLTASDAAANDFFGIDVSVEGDTAVIGPWGDDGPAGTEQGSVYIFVREGTTWRQLQKLTASDAAEFDYLGSSVSIDGDTVVAGAPLDYGPAGGYVGSAYVFVAGAGCPIDLDGDGSVSIGDLLLVLAQWGPCPPQCFADVDGDGDVGIADLLYVLAGWGACP